MTIKSGNYFGELKWNHRRQERKPTMKIIFEKSNVIVCFIIIFLATYMFAMGFKEHALWLMMVAVLLRTFILEEVIKARTNCQVIQFNEGSRLYVNDQTGLLAQAIAKHGIKNITKVNENDTTDVL